MSTATSTVVNVDFSGLVDELGLIKAQAADLKAREDAIKATLQDAGITTLEGKFFRVAISETHRAPKIDWEAIAAYEARIQNGFELFGKYYRGLWS